MRLRPPTEPNDFVGRESDVDAPPGRADRGPGEREQAAGRPALTYTGARSAQVTRPHGDRLSTHP
ncbi:hypothetical protein GCM10010412_035060 [Nonomuraea recticatena]|uniref:Uncharacterized protein n=1 Tax=Nonomuraea recticatena TaxID=46178 RepID=A0ABN3RVE7_9ACTN